MKTHIELKAYICFDVESLNFGCNVADDYAVGVFVSDVVLHYDCIMVSLHDVVILSIRKRIFYKYNSVSLDFISHHSFAPLLCVVFGTLVSVNFLERIGGVYPYNAIKMLVRLQVNKEKIKLVLVKVD